MLAVGSAIAAVITGCFGNIHELFQDETYVVWLDRSGWQHIADFIPFEPFPPLYHYLMKIWIDLGGESEVWIRAQSGLCYLASFAVLWWLGRSIFSRSERFGIFVLLIACKMLGDFAIFGRFFELFFLESCVVLISFVGLYTRRMPRLLALPLLMLGNFAGIMTHYYFAFCLIAQGVAYLLLYRWRRLGDFVIGAVLPVVAFALVWGPTFQLQLASGRFSDTKIPPPWKILLEDTYFGKRWLIILPSLLMLLLIGHRQGRWRLNSANQLKTRVSHFLGDERTRVFALLWVVTFFGPFVVSLRAGERFLKIEPYIVLSSLPFFALLILSIARSDRLLRIICGLLIIGFVSVFVVRSRINTVRDPFPAGGTRVAVEKMLEKARPGDIIVCLDNYMTKIDYYVRHSPSGVHPEIVGFPRGLEQHPGWQDYRGLKDRAAFKATTVEYAETLARTLKARPGCRVWLIDAEWSPELTRIVFEAFDSAMKRAERIEVPRGVGFTEIINYEPLPELVRISPRLSNSGPR